MIKLVNLDDAIYTKYTPEPLAIISSYDIGKDRFNAMLSSWTTKLSSDPFMFGVPLWKKGYSYKLIEKEREFVLSVPGEKLADAAKLFGRTHGDVTDKFKSLGLATAPSTYVKPPLLLDAILNFECKVESTVDVGDHILFIASILAGYRNEDVGQNILVNFGFTEKYAEIRTAK